MKQQVRVHIVTPELWPPTYDFPISVSITHDTGRMIQLCQCQGQLYECHRSSKATMKIVDKKHGDIIMTQQDKTSAKGFEAYFTWHY